MGCCKRPPIAYAPLRLSAAPEAQRSGACSGMTLQDANRRTGDIVLSDSSVLGICDPAEEVRMTTLATTVIMKTDIRGSTVRFRALPEVDLDTLLTEHRALVSRVAAVHDGRMVKPEGDGFWLVFPSVTAGARAARMMQE